MLKFRKKIAMLGLMFILCMTTMMPVMARGRACTSCGSTDTESISDLTVTETVSEPCIHGHSKHKDQVHYLVKYARIYCNNCNEGKVLNQISRVEMDRVCGFAR